VTREERRRNMSREREKILRMVADGTITPEDGERLLGRLDPGAVGTTVVEPGREPNGEKTGPLKYLRVVIDSDDDKINIRVPIALIRTGIKLTTIIPSDASEQLSEHGIDLSRLSELDGEDLMDALRELKVDIEAGDGDVIRIFCE
jgi:hypothetical protein